MVIPVWSASVHPGREVVGIPAEAQAPAAGAQSLPKASLNSKKHITVVATFGAGCQTLACLAFRRLAALSPSSLSGECFQRGGRDAVSPFLEEVTRVL